MDRSRPKGKRRGGLEPHVLFDLRRLSWRSPEASRRPAATVEEGLSFAGESPLDGAVLDVSTCMGRGLLPHAFRDAVVSSKPFTTANYRGRSANPCGPEPSVAALPSSDRMP